MGDAKIYRLTCPDCRLTRNVFLYQIKRLKSGAGSARCIRCHHTRRKADAEKRARQPKPQLLPSGKPKGFYSAAARSARSEYGPLCRHCKVKPVNRPRGLCWTCYYDFRELYPSISKYANRGIMDSRGPAPMPAIPTDAPAGSLAKMRVMHARAMRGESLFHPLDNAEIAPDCPFADRTYRGGDDNGLQAA
jgi:hypothetical protein